MTAEVIAIVVGGARPLWLLTPLLLAAVGGVVALARGVPPPESAHMLDTGLGLHDRVGTALELQGASSPPSGMASLVVDEADVALAESLDDARAVDPRSRVEWAWTLVAAAAVALAVLAPSIAHSHTSSNAGALRAGAASGSRNQNTSTRRATSSGLARSKSSKSVRRAPSLPRGVSFTAGLVNSNPHAAPSTDFSLYGNGGHVTAAQLAQLAREGLAGASQRVAGVGGSTARAGAGGSTGGSASPPGIGASGAAGSQALAGLNGGALPTAGATPAAQRAVAQAGGHAGSSPGRAGAGIATGGAHGRQTGGGSSGGDTAGSARGVLNLGFGLVPELSGSSALSLQAGYAPFNAGPSSNSERISQNPNGGGGPSRTARANGGVGGSGGSDTGFAVIPPTVNSFPSAIQILLQGYFGTANQLNFSGW